jgi:hypothetical protein
MSFGKRTSSANTDRRSAAREKYPVDAHIMVHTGPPITCKVLNMSATGARISLTKTFGLPPVLELRIRGTSRRAKIVRKGTGEIAIRFI